MSTTEELHERKLERKSSGFGLENQEYGRRDRSHWPCGTLYPQKLTLTLRTGGGRSVGIVCSRTRVIEFFLVVCDINVLWTRQWSFHLIKCKEFLAKLSNCQLF
jgi:hypothetical protein